MNHLPRHLTKVGKQHMNDTGMRQLARVVGLPLPKNYTKSQLEAVTKEVHRVLKAGE